ncbi:MAG: fimbria major subunit [Muribaculaceae bacterium]|nr:fimbria major subunit [Muribaculaceae bacterium]
MKRFNLLSYASGLVALLMTACSSSLPENGPTVYEKDETRYVQIAISNPPATRAAEFEDGIGDENTVKDAYFVFYDRFGAVVGDNSIVDLTFNQNPAGSNLSVGQIATTTVRLSIPRGSNLPEYVIAFLNPVNYEEVGDQANMNDLRNSIRTNYLCSHKCFAMNNSAYYGNNPISGDNNVKIVGAPVYAEQLHASAAAAEASAAPIEIYVERYAAKVKVVLKDDGIEDQKVGEAGNEYSLKFVPEAWSINADAPEMYASKRFENSNSADHLVPTYAEVQEMLGTWTTWNDAPNHRSYWACSPGYYATKFPAVSDDIIDEAPEGTGAGVAVGDYALRYYSYNQIADQSENNKSDGKGNTVFNNGGTNWKYVLENTMGKDAFKSANPKAAAPSVVIVGHYEVWKDGAQIKDSPGFCLYADNLYFTDNVPASMGNVSTIKTVLMDRNGILAVDENGTLMTSANVTSALSNCLEVVHPSKDVRGQQKVPHRFVTLQLKRNLTAADLQGLFYKPAGADTWQPIEATDTQTLGEVIDGINKLLWAQLGNAQIYNQNKGYFSIPIQHLGITENPVAANANPPIVDGSVNWKNVRVGDFGLVRNHVYSLEVSAIKGLASGIDGPDNPIVPSMEEDEYWVKYKINILNWRVVPAQTGIVLK